MRYKNKAVHPWNVKVSESTLTPNQHIVEVKVSFQDNKLREKMKKTTNVYFAFEFKKYWLKDRIKSARVFRTNSPSKYTQEYSSRMKFTFDSPEKAALFAQGIESALDIFIMEQILEDKQGEKR
ncbi:hypothetical protein EHV15_34405 [Paenibacillus oralis]|uniref:Uncharacterized protein n=1 Tax=Paenibacillus oralis TaxID=2490856 RepID=A0A3P3T9S3_9BACL|nr:hypothetical protein [Paenibacillus oralis]RRJ54692.1 hypothetical protein EHV15_34405 [Paenibacillus oralis]